MYCPYCGNEVRENEKFCQHCGAQITVSAQNISAPAQQDPEFYQTPAAYFGGRYDSLKDFINSPVFPEKVRKAIRTCWIVLLVCAGITLIFEIMMDIPPIDAILLAALAIWLRGTYSMAPAALALALGAFSIIYGFIQNGSPSGFLIAIAGANALSNLLKAKRLFNTYKETGQI